MAARPQKTVRVFLRIRPPVRQELERRDGLDGVAVAPDDPTRCVTRRRKPDAEEEVREYPFHRCFDQDSTQDEVYERVARDTIDDVFAGYHGLIFVYGQTGTGKTYTLCCQTEGQEGILYHSVVEIFSRIQQDADYEYECSLQFVQIYNEVIQDLLAAPRPTVVNLRDDPEADGAVYLPGCTTVPVATAGECLRYYLAGDRRRSTGETLMNDTSSRSHTVFMLDVHRRPRMRKQDVDQLGAPCGDVTQGRLLLVDLAGSEKVKKTASEGLRLTEANSINGSLLVLGRVVNALSDARAAHVPYRESKLTRLLQYPLSGLGKTSIIVTVSPSVHSHDETVSAVLFGQRAMKLKVNARVHEKVDWKALALKLQALLEGGMDCVRSEAIAEQQRDYEKQAQGYREQLESLERQVQVGGLRDRAGLAEENHALRELVRALQNKVVQLDDRRRQEKKDRKALLQTCDREVELRLAAQIAQQEAEQGRKRAENDLLAAQNELLILGGTRRGLKNDGHSRDLSTSPPPCIELVDTEDSGDEGTLEVRSHDRGIADSPRGEIRVDAAAYGDTAEQLSQALREVAFLKQEKQRLQNEVRITALSNRKHLCHVQSLEAKVKHWSEQHQELEEQARSREKEFQFLEGQMRRLKAETEEHERERYLLLVSKMTEYETRMDRYRSQVQRATNEARIEANAKGKLQSRLSALAEEKAQSEEQARTLERQVAELSQRLATRPLAP